MIFLIWLTSVVVSLAPLMGWKDEEFNERIKQGVCMVRFNLHYVYKITLLTDYLEGIILTESSKFQLVFLD